MSEAQKVTHAKYQSTPNGQRRCEIYLQFEPLESPITLIIGASILIGCERARPTGGANSNGGRAACVFFANGKPILYQGLVVNRPWESFDIADSQGNRKVRRRSVAVWPDATIIAMRHR